MSPLFTKSTLILSLLNPLTGTINEFYITYLAPKKIPIPVASLSLTM